MSTSNTDTSPLRTLWRRIISHMEPPVFFGAAGLIIAFVVFGAGFSETAGGVFQWLQAAIVNTFGWFYVFTASALLLFVIVLACSRHGSLKLGPPDSEPEFSYFAWFTMLFAAGMGIGIVFWGVAEPMSHYLEPPTGAGRGEAALDQAIYLSFFHWGVHPWAIYIVFALAIAYFHFRHDLPLAPRTMLYPVLGERIYGPIGHVVDVIATVGTLFGVATSLGFGAMQINSGLSRLTGWPQTTEVQVGIIAVITLMATISVVSGLKRGIRILSQSNMVLAGVMLAFVFVAGPTVYMLDTFLTGLGAYLQELPRLSFRVEPGQRSGWQADWTLFYWSWWISWSPFVGVFVARISRGRTVREFILCVLLVPTLTTFFWMSVFGGTALYLEEMQNAGIAETIKDNPAISLHVLLDQLPLSGVTTVLATLLVVVFFITSSDSGSFVDDMVTSGGDPHPPRAQRVFWAVSEGAVAMTLLLAGGLQALRTASLTSGLPMAVVLLAAAYGFWRAGARDLAHGGAQHVPEAEQLAEDAHDDGDSRG